MFEKGTIDAYVITTIDGTQMFNSDKKLGDMPESKEKRGRQNK